MTGYRITVDVAAAERGEPAIRVEWPSKQHTKLVRRVHLSGRVAVVQGTSRDGAIAWVEAERALVVCA